MSDYSLTSEEAVKIYAHLIIARSEEISLSDSLKVLSEEDRKRVVDESKSILPYLRSRMLIQFEDEHPSLAAQVLAEIEQIDAKIQKEKEDGRTSH